MQINAHNGTNGLSSFKVRFISSPEFIINEVLQYPFTAHQIHANLHTFSQTDPVKGNVLEKNGSKDDGLINPFLSSYVKSPLLNFA